MKEPKRYYSLVQNNESDVTDLYIFGDITSWGQWGKDDPEYDEGIKLISHGPKVIRFRIIEIIHSYLHPHNKRPHLPTIAVSLS